MAWRYLVLSLKEYAVITIRLIGSSVEFPEIHNVATFLPLLNLFTLLVNKCVEAKHLIDSIDITGRILIMLINLNKLGIIYLAPYCRNYLLFNWIKQIRFVILPSLLIQVRNLK
jgi:hypothetical protein